MWTVAIAGASGYAGGELLRLVLSHPELELGVLTADSQAGRRVAQTHPHLMPIADRVLAPTSAQTLSGHDIVLLALPHGASAALVAEVPSAIVLDCGADFRLRDQHAWEAFYDTPYAGSWVYGLPELVGADRTKQRTLLTGATRVAVPGCYPTAVSLALAPGFAAGLLEPDDVVIAAASGTSGAGKSAKAHLVGAEVMGSMSAYGVGGSHRHTPEIEQNLSAAAGHPVTVSFTPSLAPMPRGILATCTARLARGADPTSLRQVWEMAYADEPFVHLLPEGQWPRTADVLGSNCAHLQLVVDSRAGRVVVSSALDNLTKGTAGAAIQCLNLALGLPETTGLPMTAVAP